MFFCINILILWEEKYIWTTTETDILVHNICYHKKAKKHGANDESDPEASRVHGTRNEEQPSTMTRNKVWIYTILLVHTKEDYKIQQDPVNVSIFY